MKKISTFLLGLSCALLVTCNKNDSANSNTTVEEDKKNIELFFDNTLDLVKAFESGNFIKALLDFTGLQNGDAKNGDWIEDMFEALDKQTGVSDYVDKHERFNLDNFKGKYDYSNKKWTKTNDSKIIINFPLTPTTKSNNCSIVISEYSDVQVSIDKGEKVYAPSKIIFSVTKDGAEIASCNAAVTWETAGFVTVKEASVSLFTAPYSHTLAIQQVKSTEYNVDATLFEGTDNPAYSIKATLKLAKAISENFFADDDVPVNTISFTISKGDISYAGSLDVNTLNKYDNPTVEQINSVAAVDILYKNSKIGDLKLKTISHEDYVFVNYKDGAADNAELYYEPFLDELDSILKKYNDNDTVIDYKRSSAKFFAKSYKRLKNAAHALFKAE
jgi:hypothetical protein